MSDALYKELREKLDQYSIGFNKTESGVEIDILKRVFTPEEAKMYLNLKRELESVEVIAERGGYDLETAEAMLFEMKNKGHLFPKTKNNIKYYAAAPVMHGIFEHQAYTIDKELAELFEQYVNEFQPKGLAARTIPISGEIDKSILITSYDDVKKIIMEKKRIGLVECACAAKNTAIETGCEKPTEVCMAFDFYAEYAIEELGYGRWISHEEAFEVLKLTEEAGLVHQSLGTTENCEAVCNCCGDCCMILKMIKAFPQPALLSGSNYQAILDESNCSQCDICIERCPMEAISAGDDSIDLNLDRCIGCGLCTTTCPSDALTLVAKPGDNIQTPPDPANYTFMRSSLDFEADVAEKV